MIAAGRGLLQRPRLLLTLCALFWAGNFVLGRAMHASTPPIGLVFWRWLVAAAIVLPFVWLHLYRQWPVLRGRLWRMVVLALLGVSAFNTLVYVGLQTTTATNSVLIQSTLPVQVLALNWLVYRTPVGAGELASLLLSLLGVVVIISGGRPLALLQGTWVAGDAWLLGAAAV
ncbi:MAG: DMT family transporter [Gammaproteobacteria bacterium]|nr:DMT family transporter [Gammaproteobacteria bacterium]